MSENANYGQGDATFQAAGGEVGIRHLVDDFYDIMANNRAYKTIFDWHPEDAELSRDKLARFLCGWMGGPRRYAEKYGSINIPAAHRHLDIGPDEHDQWLNCMVEALQQQPYPQTLKRYLAEQLAVPAGRILTTVEKRRLLR